MPVNSLHWYYLPSLGKAIGSVSMEGDEWHHAYHVLRLTMGDSLILTDGLGQCCEGIIRSATKHEGQIELTHDRSAEYGNHRQYKLCMGIAPTKSIDRTEYAVEKLVELGVDEICFLRCQHAEREKIRIDRFEKIVLSAAKQSRKIKFPVINNLLTPSDYIAQKKSEQPGIQVLCCHLDSMSKAVFENYSAGQDVVMLIGPEGGFSTNELDHMSKEQVQMTHLGPFRLRVETAAVAACASIHLINEMKHKS